ncbi:unnamed protein product [Toxocara canis]|uniref:TFIIIC_delta domain-containing protein n=1 Tax=Toxocara canis TaxID=6265 RepID=A0A183U159_TOXCA|nr:unnamed protein product [Toxocara canis]
MSLSVVTKEDSLWTGEVPLVTKSVTKTTWNPLEKPGVNLDSTWKHLFIVNLESMRLLHECSLEENLLIRTCTTVVAVDVSGPSPASPPAAPVNSTAPLY